MLVLEHTKIMPDSGRIVGVCPMLFGRCADLIVQLRQIYVTEIFDRVCITIDEVISA